MVRFINCIKYKLSSDIGDEFKSSFFCPKLIYAIPRCFIGETSLYTWIKVAYFRPVIIFCVILLRKCSVLHHFWHKTFFVSLKIVRYDTLSAYNFLHQNLDFLFIYFSKAEERSFCKR